MLMQFPQHWLGLKLMAGLPLLQLQVIGRYESQGTSRREGAVQVLGDSMHEHT
jgi:hypothetical protein